MIDVDAATLAEAAELGRRAARSTGSLTDNPYAVTDSRNGIWSDAWTDEVKSLSKGKRR